MALFGLRHYCGELFIKKGRSNVEVEQGQGHVHRLSPVRRVTQYDHSEIAKWGLIVYYVGNLEAEC